MCVTQTATKKWGDENTPTLCSSLTCTEWKKPLKTIYLMILVFIFKVYHEIVF